MSAIVRVRRTRVALLGAVAGAALLWATLLFALTIALVALTDLIEPLTLGLRRGALPAAALVALVGFAIVLWRGRHARSLAHVALFIEERAPALQFALVTAIDFPSARGTPALERVVDRVDFSGVLRASVRRGLAGPAVAVVLALLVLAAMPRGARERALRPRAGDLLAATRRAPLESRLATIVVRIEPPPYVRQLPHTLDDPSSVTALVGSRVVVLGRGAALGMRDSLAGALATESLRSAVSGDTWSFALAMPRQPAVLRLTDRGDTRLVTLDPRVDDAPVVTLVAPKNDTAYAEARGRIALAAGANDDIGLVHAEFELMHTAGSGERFVTRRWTVGGVSAAGSRSVSLAATLLLDTLHLGPGDVLHIRAVAWDANDVTGPDTGASDTRTIRIADPRERDTVSLVVVRNAVLDTTALSERMLILRAETLQLRKPRMAADTFVAASRRLAAQQDDVRGGVQSVINDLMSVASPGLVSTAEISLLVRAVSAMADAQAGLREARVADALPHMRRALAFLLQVRDMQRRYYLRGVQPKLVVDLERVRLKGTDPVAVAARTGRAGAPDARKALLDRLDRALQLLARGWPRTADSLTMIRVDALAAARDAAEPLGRAIDALRHRADPMPALRLARRRLERATDAGPSLPAWLGAR